VSAGEQADEDALDHRLLTDDNLAHLGAQLFDEGRLLVYELVDHPNVHERCPPDVLTKKRAAGPWRAASLQPTGREDISTTSARRGRPPRLPPRPPLW